MTDIPYVAKNRKYDLFSASILIRFRPMEVGLLESYGTLPDEELAQRIIAGDREAIVQLLVHRCGPGIRHLIHGRFHGVGAEFAEAVSEAYLFLSRNDWAALRAFRGHSATGQSCSLVHYIYCILSRYFWRKYSNFLQEKQIHMPLDMVEEDSLSVRDGRAMELLTHDEVMAIIMSLENKLDRQVLVLYLVENRSVEEVARALNMSVNSVYTRNSRALKKLRDRIKKGARHE